MSRGRLPMPAAVSRSLKLVPSAGAVVAVLALAGMAWAGEKRNDELFSLKHVLQVPGNPLVSFDISWVDSNPAVLKYFLADRSNKSIDVYHTGATPTLATQIIPPATHAFAGTPGIAFPCITGAGSNDCAGPDGVLTLNDVHGREIWVGDGPTPDPSCVTFTPCSTVKVFPIGASGAAVPSHTIPTYGHARADELCFDPVDHVVLMANDAEDPWPFISFISTTNYTVLSKITMDGTGGTPKATNGIEQCQWSPRTGKFYLNIPEVGTSPHTPGDDSVPGVVLVIDPKTRTIVNTFKIPIDNCAGPQGMAIGPDPQILLGCNALTIPGGLFNTVVINEHSGHVMATLANEGGDDEVWFNPGDGHYFLAGGSFLPNEQLGIVDSRFSTEDQTIQTGTPNGTTRRAHSVAADLNTNLVFVPIPGTGGGTPPSLGFQSALCGATAALQTAGCVAVFGTTNDDRPIVVRERGPDDKQD
jgi:hypothetical protein